MATTQDDCSGWARPSRLTAYDLQPILDQVASSNCECGEPHCEWDRPRRLTTLELDEVLYGGQSPPLDPQGFKGSVLPFYMDLYGEPI
jgi:hypothetical protein